MGKHLKADTGFARFLCDTGYLFKCQLAGKDDARKALFCCPPDAP
jgi:hypothetical protein